MTLLNDRPAEVTAGPARRERSLGQKIVSVITTTDHKTIGRLYMATSFTFFLHRRRDGAGSSAASWPSRACRS